jgi:putative redox protein
MPTMNTSSWRYTRDMSTKTIHIDALDPHGGDRVRFVAQNPRHDRMIIEAHHAEAAADSPPSVGLGPMEALLAALGTCTAVDVQDIMRKRRTPLSSYRLEIIGERADDTPKRYTSITVRHIGSGDGVAPEQLEKAAHLSHEKYCSVASSLSHDIHWVIEAQVEAEPVAAD